jgi:CHAT domain-containing protein
MIFYEDFDLRVESDGDRFAVQARYGSQAATEPLGIDTTLFRDVRHLEGADPETVRRKGADLFDALIHGRVRDLYQRARGHAGGDSASGLRIRLIVDPRDERLRPLIRLPWEILRDRRDDANGLPALDPRRPVVRTLESFDQQLTPAGGPLQRVLLVLADPIASRTLDLNRERAATEAALERISIRPIVVANATRDALFEAIADTNAQIVHFMGHSDLEPETGEGVLCLDDGHGNEDRLPGSVFAGFFAGKPAPRLLILTSCLSAAQGNGSPFAGIAFALVAAGLPAVIAMQSKVRDDSTSRFTERLYRRLSDGDPIEAAVADARRALSIGYSKTLEWASPVLFMRDVPSPVVEKQSEKPPAPPDVPLDMDIKAPDIDIKITNEHVENQINAGWIQNFHQHGKAGRP